MKPMDKATADIRSVQSFAFIKNTEHVFTLELEMDYPSETSLCTVATFSTDTPSPIFFWWKGAVVHRLSGKDNPVFKLSVEIDG